MGRLLGDIKTTDIVARRADLAVAQEVVLDSSVIPSGTVINRGEVLAKYVPSDASAHVGKHRPYAEGPVTGAFSTAAKTFTLDVTVRAALQFQPGDVIEGTDGTALGTIATYDPATGAGTLVANSANNLAADGTKSARLAKANWALDLKRGMILQDECIVEGIDLPQSAFREGFFVKSRTSLTASAISELGAVEETSNEVRIQ